MPGRRIAGVLAWVLLLTNACVNSSTGESEQSVDGSGGGSTDVADVSAELSTRISQRVSEGGFAGSVLFSRDGGIVFHRTYGAFGSIPGESEKSYWIASGAKQFTGALVALLAGSGTLDLDAPISEYLDKVPDDKSPITLRQLLTHSSGLDQRYASEGITDRAKAIKAILRTRLVHPPGSKYLYSNDGFTLAAIIAEQATGQSFEALMQSLLFEPAGLSKTGMWGFEDDAEIAPVLQDVSNQSKSIYSEGRSQANWGYRGATGIYSTTADLAKWLMWLLGSGGDPEHALSQVISPQQLVRKVEGLGALYYGLGIAVVIKDGDLHMISHIGDDDWLGHNSTVTAYADGDIIVVLSNSGYLKDGTPWSAQITRDIKRIIGR